MFIFNGKKKTVIYLLALFIILVIVVSFALYILKERGLLKKEKKVGETPEVYTASVDDPGFRVEVGEEEYVMGPTGDYFDSPFFTVETASKLHGYSANVSTYTFLGDNLDNLTNQGVVLDKGPLGQFDECGVWLDSVYKVTEQHWIGWYHAEKKCDYSVGLAHMSMAFTESLDGGRTWQKPNYPHNQVLTADKSFDGDVDKDDAGDARVLKIGDYFYMFFLATVDWQTHVARSKVSDLGKPGTWRKYYNGSFSEPGLGGKSTEINTLGRFVATNSYLDQLVSIFVSGRWGFYLEFADKDDVLKWTEFPEMIFPLVSHFNDERVDSWLDRNENMKQVYGYPSLIGPDGNSDMIGKEFYLYYMKLFDGGDFNINRYLLRRKITLYKNSVDPYWAKLKLLRYQKNEGQKYKVSTEIAKPSEGYVKQELLGYLLPYSHNDFRALYECYISMWDDYVVVAGIDPSVNGWQYCVSEGDTFVRTIGWISKKETQETSQPLYRCFDEQKLDHFVSKDSNCEGKQTDFLLGYAFEQSFNGATSSPDPVCQYDYDDNGEIGTGDLLYFLSNWSSDSTTKLLQVLGNWGLSCD